MSQTGLITISDYARHRGVSQPTVSVAVRQGRISYVEINGRKMIDPEQADREWVENSRPRPKSGKRAPDDIRVVPATYDEARTQREIAEAQISALKAAELAGDLVRVGDVRAKTAKVFAGIRETFLQMPSRIVPLLAAASGADEMDLILRREINDALRSVAEADE